MFVVLSGRGSCNELITYPEESYRLWCVACVSRNVVNEETPVHGGCGGGHRAKNKQIDVVVGQRHELATSPHGNILLGLVGFQGRSGAVR